MKYKYLIIYEKQKYCTKNKCWFTSETLCEKRQSIDDDCQECSGIKKKKRKRNNFNSNSKIRIS